MFLMFLGIHEHLQVWRQYFNMPIFGWKNDTIVPVEPNIIVKVTNQAIYPTVTLFKNGRKFPGRYQFATKYSQDNYNF